MGQHPVDRLPGTRRGLLHPGPGGGAGLLHAAHTGVGGEPSAAVLGGFRDVGVVGAYPNGDEVAFEVRAFVNEGDGVWEDPVTGSLNASVAQWLISTRRAPTSYVAQQGTRLHRRGRVHVDSDGSDVWVGGATVVGVAGAVAL